MIFKPLKTIDEYHVTHGESMHLDVTSLLVRENKLLVQSRNVCTL